MPAALHDALRRRTHAFASSLNTHRLILYATLSLVAVAVAIANALRNYSNFYSIAIYLSRSSRSVLVLANFGLLIALLCGHLVQTIFFGALRPNEVERLYDRLWFFITESLLAFTIFRDEFDIPFALMFGFLLFVKSFHWLAGDRIEWMDQRPYPGPSTLFHIRMGTLFIILWSTDLLMFFIAVESTLAHGVGGMVLFASEYGILMASMGNTIAKYLLSTYELHRASRRGGENAPPWENKSMWLFYIELATDFVKLTTYLVFFTIIITFYGLPLNIVRDVYITARSFVSRLRALHRYQTATRNMDQRYPNATEEEMAAMSDRTCIICREEMVLPPTQGPPLQNDGPNTTPKKLPCGHVFHFHCLRSWLERQQSCPTCRRTVLDNNAPTLRPGGINQNPQPQNGANPPPQPQQGVANGPVPVQNPPAGNNPLGNPFDLVNRFFGPPPQNQPQPGQAPIGLGALPQVAQNPGNPQPALVIQYHVQYQLDRQPQNSRQDLAQGLQPAPVFQGFYGPGGIWQQWPAPAQPEDTAASQTATRAQSAQEDVNRDATADQIAAQSDPSPREAAREAALRRLNQTTNFSASESSTPFHPRHSSGSSSAADTAGRMAIPFLIPLHNVASGTTPSTYAPQGDTSHLPNPSQGNRSSGHNPLHEIGTLLELSQLPPTISNEQLALMDQLTRESIDERLRILEGVSGAVYRCIDELMKLRSALPTSHSPLPRENSHSKRPGPADAGPSQSSEVKDEHLGLSSDSDGSEGTEGFVVEPQNT